MARTTPGAAEALRRPPDESVRIFSRERRQQKAAIEAFAREVRQEVGERAIGSNAFAAVGSSNKKPCACQPAAKVLEDSKVALSAQWRSSRQNRMPLASVELAVERKNPATPSKRRSLSPSGPRELLVGGKSNRLLSSGTIKAIGDKSLRSGDRSSIVGALMSSLRASVKGR